MKKQENYCTGNPFLTFLLPFLFALFFYILLFFFYLTFDLCYLLHYPTRFSILCFAQLLPIHPRQRNPTEIPSKFFFFKFDSCTKCNFHWWNSLLNSLRSYKNVLSKHTLCVISNLVSTVHTRHTDMITTHGKS